MQITYYIMSITLIKLKAPSANCNFNNCRTKRYLRERMTLSRRQKVTITLLLFYWPAIFTLTHIPLPPMPAIFRNIWQPDKIFHCIVYLILVFLLWSAISPFGKVNWGRPAAWWILLVVVWYGVTDEWLQGYVNRSPDVMDFLADLTGALTGLILLSFFSFWPAFLVLTGGSIFITANLTRQANWPEQLPVINTAFCFFAYVFFCLLWMRYMHHFFPVKAPQLRWLTGALALPTALLIAAELFSAVAGGGFRPQDIAVSLGGIAVSAAAVFLAALLKHNFAGKTSRER